MTANIEVLMTGLFGGAGATLLWELLFRPIRERRSIAEVLAAEISINIQLLGGASHYANPKKVPPDFSLSTQVFESITGKIGELPPKLVGEVVFLYSYFKELNEHPRTYVDLVKELRTCEPASSNYKQTESEILACVRVFNSYVQKAIVRINIVQPLLLQTAFPWWSPRHWRRSPSVALTMEEVARRVAKSEVDRQSLVAEIEQRTTGVHLDADRKQQSRQSAT